MPARIAVLACLLAAVAFASGDRLVDPPPPAFECRWAATPPTIDGDGTEPVWAAAQVIDTFARPWLPAADRPAKEATRAKLLWDHEYLYFLAEMADADLFAEVTEHDGPVWTNDAFELFFKPAADKSGYFEFEVNAAGTVFDAFFPKWDPAGMAKHVKVGEFHVEAKVKRRGTLHQRGDTDQGWTVEGRIPWSDFLRAGGRPAVGEAWRFALCRCNYHKDWKEPDLTTTAAIGDKRLPAFFHQTDGYPPITFVGPGGAKSRPAGLDRLPPLTTSTVVGSPDPPPPYRVKRLYPDFRPGYPIMLKPVPGTDQMLLITQPRPYAASVLSRLTDRPDAKTADLVKLMDTPDGGTAYDLAFHPKFADNGFVFVGWNGPGKGVRKGKFTRVTRYTMGRTPPYHFDPASAKTVIEWESDGHNGGAVCFGLDGMLYVTSGDGTSDSDVDVVGQRPDGLLAKVLRIDVDRPAAGKAYSVPKDNPFVGDGRFAPETWAYGLRNPWRISFDPPSGQLWVGNNGQDLWEQAYLVRKGDNFGWSVTEGGQPFYPDRKPGPTPISKPTAEHHHADFRSLTGGDVYHGDRLPDLRGAYLYGDYSTGRVWGMKHGGTKPVWHKELARTTLKLTAFTTNTRGELLLLDHGPEGEGGFYTLEPTPPAGPGTFPRRLSASGLFESVPEHRMKPGVLPYSVNVPFWSDGLLKQRWVALPPGGKVGYRSAGGWNFPDGTVIVKSFATDPGKWVETRFLTRQGGEWAGYSYRWNDTGTDAELVPAAGMDRELTVGGRKQTWHYPSRAECMVCHSRAANFVLGLCTVQMNKDHDSGGRVDNQIRTLDRAGLFAADWAEEVRGKLRDRAAAKGLKDKAAEEYVAVHAPQPGQRPPTADALLDARTGYFGRLPDPHDPKVDLTARAKAWLHVNCASCHVEAGGGNAAMQLDVGTPLDRMRLLDVKPLHRAFDLPDARLVAPGDPDRSVLVRRAAARGPHQMPPIGSTRADEAGVALLREWVRSLGQ